MEFWTPYNDISELGNLYHAGMPGTGRREYTGLKPTDVFSDVEKMIQTPLAFAHFARSQYRQQAPEYQKMLEDAGWKLVSSTLNWHSSHRGDNELCLWMKKYPQNLPVEKLRDVPNRADYYGDGRHMYPCHKSFLFGCGGRLLEGFKDIRDEDIAWTKFLTLIRIPVEKKITPARERWLRAMNYRPLPAEFNTSVATYWVNGFEKWPGKDQENEFWNRWTEPKHPAIRRASIKPAEEF